MKRVLTEKTVRPAGGVPRLRAARRDQSGPAGRTSHASNNEKSGLAVSVRQSITLDALWPRNAVIVQRPFDSALDWLPSGVDWRERTSAAPLPLAGTLPIVCHRASARSEGVQLLRDCGLRLPPEILVYETLAEMRGIMAAQVLRGRRIGITYTADEPVAPDGAFVNEIELVRWLNDKANVAALLPAGAAPERRLVRAADYDTALDPDRLRFPLVLKASSRFGSGGGLDVVICHAAEDLASARLTFAPAAALVIEEYLPFEHTWCLHFAVSDTGVTCLGAAEQVCDRQGKYHGNWCDDAGPGTRGIAFCRAAAQAGWERGYRGFMGADMGATNDGREYVFDLNFRNNGSTPQVVLRSAIAAKFGATCSRLCAGVAYAGSYLEMVARLRHHFGRGAAVPLLTFDAAQLGDAHAKPSCNLLVIGPTRDAVRERMAVLREEGFALEPEPALPHGCRDTQE